MISFWFYISEQYPNVFCRFWTQYSTIQRISCTQMYRLIRLCAWWLCWGHQCCEKCSAFCRCLFWTSSCELIENRITFRCYSNGAYSKSFTKTKFNIINWLGREEVHHQPRKHYLLADWICCRFRLGTFSLWNFGLISVN